ncbi:MAG TPA: hypothetical protein VKA09_17030, partial [Nitrososphaeraceae archaeon]|nr:hypothetical protein [Nitrososphaeraceae archaeon]
GTILSFVSVAPTVVILALALITVVYSNAAIPKPVAASVTADNNRETARGLFLILFSIGYGMMKGCTLALFNETVKYQLTH